ncbi:HAMP domain-containing histidine kinase [Nocardiopsis sp. CNT-189]|uniref:HAMP domain-containing sensor histidine kinase n=1 Tax=Nocardiopsis oceanisediminis TaxID=2816862 RepID=UPI003B296EDB
MAGAAARGGVRRRLVLLSVLVTGAALLAGSVGGVLVLNEALNRSAHTALASAAAQIEDGLGAGEPKWKPPRKVDLAQLRGPGGRTVMGCGSPASDCAAPSADLSAGPLGGPPPAPGETVEGRTPGGLFVLARGVRFDGADHVVVVGVSSRPADVALRTAVLLIAAALPLMLLLVAAAAHALAGRTLAPVERIRERVASIGEGGDLSRRVPEPGGGDEISRLATTMNAMLARLEAAQRNQRRFVADAGHELRSPLTTVTGILELARRDGGRLDPGSLRTADEELGRIRVLVNDLLLLARTDESGLGLRREEVDLDDVLDGERLRLRAAAGPDVEVEAVLEPVKVVGDRDALVRLARNLADNAVRHARRRVVLAVRAEGEDAVAEVADDGPGVPEEDRVRVFERFVRLDSARGRGSGGAGLGLAIVAGIAREHGGSAEVAGAPEGGALFRVRLPRA